MPDDRFRVARAPALVVAAALTLALGDLLWWLTRHPVPRACGNVRSYNPLAAYLTVAAAATAAVGLFIVLTGWVNESVVAEVGSRRRRRLTVALGVLVLLGVVLSLAIMYLDSTVALCLP